MNNKGFAITTVIYGLSILGILLIVIIMGTLSTNRANVKQLSREVDNELNFYSRAFVSYSFTTENDLQQFEVPAGQSGWYRIELWGASGNGVDGGKGAYTTGIIKLTEGDIIYIKVGGSSSGQVGGSTDVRLAADNGRIGLLSRIMVAAGGGTAIGADGGTLCGYNLDMTGRGGAIKDNFQLDSAKTPNYIGTQSVSSSPQSLENCVVGSENGEFKTNDSDPSISGDGYYISNASDASNYGGSSYISGYAGVVPITNKIYPTGTTPNLNSRKTTISGYELDADGNISNGGDLYSDYVFRDGLMLPGVKSGNGLARIEKLSIGSNSSTASSDKDDSLRFNSHFYNISSLVDCSEVPIKKIELIRDGNSIPLTPTPLADQDGLHCVNYSNSESTLLDNYYDEIVVWHNTWENMQKENLTINYYQKGEHENLKSITLNLTDAATETLDGYRISAYQPNFYNTSNNLDKEGGNYYIFSILSENKVISAQQNKNSDMDPIKLNPLVGENRQKWSIAKIPDKLSDDPTITNEYSLIELTRYGALSVDLDEGIVNSKITAYNKFNSLSRNNSQIWKIYPVGNGTFYINTSTAYFGTEMGSLLATPSKENGYADHEDELVVAKGNASTARFRFYKLDY